MKTKLKHNSNDGFTILEVLTAMTILGISLLLLLSMGMTALDANDWSHKTTRSAQALQEKLEHIRVAVDEIDDGADTLDGMIRSWSVRNEDKFLRKVTVAINWEDLKRMTHNDTMIAYVRTDTI